MSRTVPSLFQRDFCDLRGDIEDAFNWEGGCWLEIPTLTYFSKDSYIARQNTNSQCLRFWFPPFFFQPQT